MLIFKASSWDSMFSYDTAPVAVEIRLWLKIVNARPRVNPIARNGYHGSRTRNKFCVSPSVVLVVEEISFDAVGEKSIQLA